MYFNKLALTKSPSSERRAELKYHLVKVESIFSGVSPRLRVAGDGLLSSNEALAANSLGINIALVVAPVHQVQVKPEGFQCIKTGLEKVG